MTTYSCKLIDTDFAAESWKAESRSLWLTLFFNIEVIIYNILLIVFGIRYTSYDSISDEIMVFLFPSLKSFFLWLNIEFAFRYFKTAQIMKHVFHSDPLEQLKAQQPSVTRRNRIIDYCLLLLAVAIVVTETILCTKGFTCLDRAKGSRDEKQYEHDQERCKQLILAG